MEMHGVFLNFFLYSFNLLIIYSGLFFILPIFVIFMQKKKNFFKELLAGSLE